MAKRIISKHRNRALAEKKARRIGGEIVERRQRSGAFSKRGRFFTFIIQTDLTRYTVGITFPFRKEYGSVLAQLYTSKWTPGSKGKRVDRDKASTREAAVRQVEVVVRYARGKFWFDLEAATSTETLTVPYDEKFAERIVVITETDEEQETTVYKRRK